MRNQFQADIWGFEMLEECLILKKDSGSQESGPAELRHILG